MVVSRRPAAPLTLLLPAAFDREGCGTVTVADFSLALRNLGLPAGTLRRARRQAHKNAASGEVDYREWLSAMVVTSEPQSRASRSPSELEAALGAVAADDVPEADGRDVAAAAARVKAVLKEQRLTLQVRAATMLLRCCSLCYCSSPLVPITSYYQLTK